MALARTLGTAANNTLGAFIVNTDDQTAAQVAQLFTGILNDQINAGGAGPQVPGAYTQQGLLIVPNRGVLQARPGDIIGLDATGWPILLSAKAAANANWVHT